MNSKLHTQTKVVRTQIPRTEAGEHSAPLYLTSSFLFESAEEMADAFADRNDHLIYSRFDNPNFTEFTDKICAMEGAEAGHATASGMAAVFSTFAALCKAGDHILSCRSIFGSTHTVFTKILPKWNIETSYVDGPDVKSWSDSVKPNTKMLYIETPTNPGLEIIDLQLVGELCAKHNLILVVDNCFASPYLQQPAKFGADLIIHSATKFIDGQGRTVGGAVVGRADLIKEIRTFCRSTGPALSPFNAWLLSKSMETLAVRMDRHCASALALAEKLEANSQIEKVIYPFLSSHPGYATAKKQMSQGGALVAFIIKGGIDAGRKFLNNLKLSTLTANLGDSRTIVSHPASTTHAKLSEQERLSVGILPGMIRVSVGLEHIEDIIVDIEQALEFSMKRG